jgi:hypothetical protein
MHEEEYALRPTPIIKLKKEAIPDTPRIDSRRKGASTLRRDNPDMVRHGGRLIPTLPAKPTSTPGEIRIFTIRKKSLIKELRSFR